MNLAVKNTATIRVSSLKTEADKTVKLAMTAKRTSSFRTNHCCKK